MSMQLKQQTSTWQAWWSSWKHLSLQISTSFEFLKASVQSATSTSPNQDKAQALGLPDTLLEFVSPTSKLSFTSQRWSCYMLNILCCHNIPIICHLKEVQGPAVQSGETGESGLGEMAIKLRSGASRGFRIPAELEERCFAWGRRAEGMHSH